MTLTDSIASRLTLTLEGEKYNIPGGNLKKCHLRLDPRGFEGTLGFWISDEHGGDRLHEVFASDELIAFELSLQQYTFEKRPTSEPMIVKGLVGQRSLYEEQYHELKKNPVLYRYYQCNVYDTAQFIWRQHYPCELVVNQTLKQVISAQQGSLIDIQYDWTALDQQHPLIFLPTRTTFSESIDTFSFYDFLLGYLARQGAFWRYDYAKNSYVISDKKPKPAREAKYLPHQIRPPKIHCAAVNLQTQRLLNADSEQASITTVKENPLLAGVKRDFLIITPFSATAEDRKNQQLQHSEPPKPTLSFDFVSMPDKPMIPGQGLELDETAWGKTAFTKSAYRAIGCELDLQAVDGAAQHDLNMKFTQYRGSYHCQFEHQDDVSVDSAKPSPGPCYVDGVIVSEPGKDEDKTYQYLENDSTKQQAYRIHVPLWDQEIKVLFQPDFLPPHFYFPLYKGCKVRLALNLFEAHICRVLDWGAGVFLKQDTAGNHILFGDNSKSETSLRHVYDSQKPVFTLVRTRGEDTEKLTLQEGKIIFQVQEDEA